VHGQLNPLLSNSQWSSVRRWPLGVGFYIIGISTKWDISIILVGIGWTTGCIGHGAALVGYGVKVAHERLERGRRGETEEGRGEGSVERLVRG